MTEPNELFFAWEGANHPAGPWMHLRVLELRGEEALSRPYHFELELVGLDDAPEVDVDQLIGARASLLIATRVEPAYRIVHGLVVEAEQLGQITGGTRYRVVLAPPFMRAGLMRKSLIYVDKTLSQIIDSTLSRQSLGAGLVKESERGGAVSGDRSGYTPANATYGWRILDEVRLTDPEARPYCVQYDESDLDFVSRLLEEEGISYHFEHADGVCRLVLTDFDGGRMELDPATPLGIERLGYELPRFQAGRSLRPRSVHLGDYDWRKPALDLRAESPSGVTDFTDIVHPGRYQHSAELGKRLAEKREQRLDSERQYAIAESRCRLLSAGTIFTVDHPSSSLCGAYLVTRVQHFASQRGSFGEQDDAQEPYRCTIECLRCGKPGARGESHFRPARRTARPRIYGSQTAFVTAEPGAADAEINVGGPANIGCVRLRFHWDADTARHEQEPTSCWVRVSQLFAGSAGHGAMWHPRVGDEVVVEHLDGDPDRPIVTGRVYNGVNLAPEDATARPTYSAIKSLTSPHDGGYNLLAFEDQQGAEQIIIHAARDLDIQVEHNTSRGVGVNETAHVVGDQSTTVDGERSIEVGGSESTSAGGNISEFATNIEMTAQSDLAGHAGAKIALDAAGPLTADAGASATVSSPLVTVKAGATALVDAGATLLLNGGAIVRLHSGASLLIDAGANVAVMAPAVEIKGTATVVVDAPSVTVAGGGAVNVEAGSSVNIKGAAVNLNC